MKSVKLRLAELFIGKIDDSVKRGFWLVSELIQKHKLFLLLLLAVGVFVGLIEGAAIGLLAFSVIVITGETSSCLDSLVSASQYLPVDLCSDYNKYDMFVLIIVLSIIVQVIKSIVTYVSSYLGVVLNTRISYEMQSKVFSHMMRLSYQDVNHFSVGERQALVGNANVFSKLALAANNLITVFFVLASYFLILITMSWKLTILSTVLLLVLVVFILPFLDKIRNLARDQRDNGVLLGRRMVDYFFAIRLIKIYQRSEEVIDAVKHIVARRVGLARQMALLQNAIPNLQETILVVSVSLILLGSFYIAGDNAAQVLPQILAYILVLHRCNGRVVTLNGIRTSLTASLAPLEHISDFLNHGVESNQSRMGRMKEVDSDWKKLNIDSLSFSYNAEDMAVLRDVNLSITRGQTIALVGQSGSGKSTLVDLMTGLLEPTKGSLNFDKTSSIEAKHSSWVSQFSMVSQNDLILDGTVMDNLRFANPDVTDDQVVRACKIAEAHDFIQELDNGYHSILGERGYKVSGGQIQRIAFARALLKEAPVLILDEATSALDNIVERRIIEKIVDQDNDRTLVMIAHRLSTVMGADIIVVFDSGKIVDSGTHDELLSRAGVYKSMWHSTENQE